MELRHLRYFVAVAETRHFNRAAERQHMAQPPLSQAIRQLEAELGVELLTRTTRHVALTPAGEVLYVDALRILAEVADSTVRMRHFAEGRSGVLRLGLTGVAAYTLLPRLARVVEQEHAADAAVDVVGGRPRPGAGGTRASPPAGRCATTAATWPPAR